ncbi:membrane protein insertase YidC [bacterium]|nr:MAG: membrane protein insertase YidC [bacterium]
MEKRVIIAVVLSIAVILLYPYALKKFYPAKELPAQNEQKAEIAQATAPQAEKTPTTSVKPINNAVPQTKQTAKTVKEELTIVETPLYKAIFTNAGAGIKKWEIKKYKETQATDSKSIAISAVTGAEASFKTLLSSKNQAEDIIFQPSKSAIIITKGQTAELVYTATNNGMAIEKHYTFKPDSYTVGVETRVKNITNAPVTSELSTVLSASLATAGVDSANYHSGPIIQTKEKLLRQESKEPQISGNGKLKWLGLENKYFIEAYIPKKDTDINWSSEIPFADAARAKVREQLTLGPNETASVAFDAFMGPKEYDLLISLKTGLEESIEFGWFSFLAKPLLVVLNFFQRYLNNYGIAIVLITVIIKVIFYPLSTYSMKSMKEMQKIQPQMAALKEKYKNDKEKQNREMMDLYKRHKINPLSGCLPMVLQIPVFIALYEVLYVAIELRHTPLFLWITDLSAKDPYYVTPVIMGVTMFIQQKMTPTTIDPTQAKMMLLMPVIFTFMFLSFPSGLVIYWLINNVLSIAQQYYIQRSTVKA